MVNGSRAAAATITTATLLLTATACGDTNDQPRSDRSSAAASSPTASASQTVSPSTSPSSSALSATHPGRLFVVPADQLGPTCPTSRPAGVVCGPDEHAYRFQPEALRTVRVVRADAGQGQAGWVVEVDLDAPGRRTMKAVTTSAARTHEFLLLMPRRTGPAITAAQVETPIAGGKVQIAGAGTRADAEQIVNQITRTAR